MSDPGCLDRTEDEVSRLGMSDNDTRWLRKSSKTLKALDVSERAASNSNEAAKARTNTSKGLRVKGKEEERELAEDREKSDDEGV